MSEISWATLSEANDRIEAEIIKEALEAQGIPAEIFQEGAMHYAYPGGRIDVCVTSELMKQAKAWFEDYQNGKLEELPEEESGEDDRENK